MAAVLAAGFAIRVFAAHVEWRTFDREFPNVWEISRSALSQDGTQYVLQADRGTWKARYFRDWDQKAYYRPPLASYYFALLFPAVGFDRVAASAVQAALAIVAYTLLFAIARREWGARVAWGALLLALAHPVLIYYDTSFEDSVLCLVLISAALAALLRAPVGPLSRALAGALMGLATLARPNVALVTAGLALWIAWPAREHGGRDATRWGSLVAFALPVVLLTSLASAHNFRASGRWSFVTETSGENLFWGNVARPEHRVELQGFWAIRDVDMGSPGFLLIESLRRRYRESSIDGALGAAARDFIVSHPGVAARNFGLKALRHLAADEIPRNENLDWLWKKGMALRLPRFPYAAVLVFAIFGLSASWRAKPRVAAAFAMPWLAVFVTEVLYFNAGRYRALAIPFLLPLAVRGGLAAAEAMREREIVKVVGGAVVLAAAIAVGARIVPAEEKARHLSASYYKAAMLQAYEDANGRLRILDERRFTQNLDESDRLDPGNLEVFSIRQKRLLGEGRFDDVLAQTKARRLTCSSDDELCQQTCDYLTEFARSARGRSAS